MKKDISNKNKLNKKVIREISKKDKDRLREIIRFVEVFHNLSISFEDCVCSVGPKCNLDFKCCYFIPNSHCKIEKQRYCEGNRVCANFNFKP